MSATASSARENNLYTREAKDGLVSIYLKNVTNSSGLNEINTDEFKSLFQDVLNDRINITFISAKSEKEADVVVDADIKNYVFSPNVLPNVMSVYGFVADSTAPKSAAKIVVDYQVIDPATGDIIYTMDNLTTEERRPVDDMVGSAAVEYAIKGNINRFLFKTFYQQRIVR